MMILTLAVCPILAQEQERRDLPVLEIPEITIVGRKVITLPFARKGEVIEVQLYEAPPPDTSLLTQRIAPQLPRGIYLHSKEKRSPWRFALSAETGSYAARGLSGVVRYSELDWEGYAEVNFAATDGHAPNTRASASAFNLGGQTFIATDNDLLGLFRLSADVTVGSESYGMFVHRDTSTERSRQHFTLLTSLTSADARQSSFQLSLMIRSLSLTDTEPGSRHESSALSPTIRTSWSAQFGTVYSTIELSYETSSLQYARPQESPSVLTISSTARWSLAETWFLHLGGKYQYGADSEGGTGYLFSPVALLRWKPSPTTELSAFWEPSIRMISYVEALNENPYLVHEPVLRTPFSQISGGLGFSHIAGPLTLGGKLALERTKDTPVHIVQNRTIQLQYAEATHLTLELNARMSLSERLRTSAFLTAHDARDVVTDRQLPMTPALRLGARGELDLQLPATVWVNLRFIGPRDVDFTSSLSLDAAVLADIGISSTVIPYSIVALELSNLFGSPYQWWKGYTAPGRRFGLRVHTSF
jgi:hypothetical protein